MVVPKFFGEKLFESRRKTHIHTTLTSLTIPLPLPPLFSFSPSLSPVTITCQCQLQYQHQFFPFSSPVTRFLSIIGEYPLETRRKIPFPTLSEPYSIEISITSKTHTGAAPFHSSPRAGAVPSALSRRYSETGHPSPKNHQKRSDPSLPPLFPSTHVPPATNHW